MPYARLSVTCSTATYSGATTRTEACQRSADEHACQIYRGLLDRGAQRAANQALNLARAASERAFAAVATFTPLRVGARVHLVFGRNPASALTFEEIRNRILDRRGHEHHGATGSVKHRALGQPM